MVLEFHRSHIISSLLVNQYFSSVKENGLGYCFDTHDREGLLIFLKSLSVAEKTVLVEMGMKSRKICEEKYSKEVILEKFVQTL